MNRQGKAKAVADPYPATAMRDSGTAVAWVGGHHPSQVAFGMEDRYRNLPDRHVGTWMPAGRPEL
jgi:hypothetical protein